MNGRVLRSPTTRCLLLKRQDLGFGVAKFVEVILAGELDHRGRSTQQNHRVLTGWRHVLLDHRGGDEPGAVRPARVRSVDGVPQLESMGVVLGELLKLWAEQNVVGGLVGVEERHDGRVGLVPQHLVDHLEHRGDARAAGHHSDVLLEGQRFAQIFPPSLTLVLDSAERPSHLEDIAPGCQRVQVLRHFSAVTESLVRLVNFEHEVKESLICGLTHWGILALHLILFVRILTPIPLASLHALLVGGVDSDAFPYR
mmetsp:Transcript_34737/g.81180  ORF Transcript_34737/g.81180 Transcript_34737/m.81180 type:complete len:255 (+) Transcript_34737:11-775(+)